MTTKLGRWSDLEDSTLIELREDATPWPEVSRLMGRPIEGCKSHLLLLKSRVKVEPLPPKRCLNLDCRKWFIPKHPGEWFHDKCRPK